MTYTYADAVYAINLYLNKALQVNLGWTPISYTNSLGETVRAAPIIPAQQQPELLATGNSFLVYGSSISPSNRLYPLIEETVVYTIWAPTAREANEVANFIHDLFIDTDHSADAVNSYLDGETAAAGRQRYISFLTVTNGVIAKAEPSEQEDGWVMATATVSLTYTKKNHSPQIRFTYP